MMKEPTHSDVNGDSRRLETATERAMYQTPCLTIYGDAARLTDHNVSTFMNDGGAGGASKT